MNFNSKQFSREFLLGPLASLIPADGVRHFWAKSRVQLTCESSTRRWEFSFQHIRQQQTESQLYQRWFSADSVRHEKRQFQQVCQYNGWEGLPPRLVFKRQHDECGLPYLALNKNCEEWLSKQDRSGMDGSLRSALYAENSLFCALQLLLPNRIGLVDRCELVRKLYDQYRIGNGEATVKNMSAYWAAKALCQELPCSSALMYGGVTGRRIKRCLTTRSMDRRSEFAQAFLMSKRATNVVSEEFVENEIEKHKDRLTADPTEEPDWFAHEIQRTVREVFVRSPKFSWGEKMKLPSDRAHYGWSCRNGGALGCLLWSKRDLCEILSDCTPKREYADEIWYPELLAMKSTAFGAVEIRGFGDDLFDRLGDAVEASAEQAVREGRKKWQLETPMCAPSAVLEACKVRVITKGPPLLQYFGKYAQSWLWKCVKSHPTFKLIGKPCEVSDIDQFWGRVPFGSSILSGDYKSATDFLCKWASDACWSAICDVGAVPPCLEQWGYDILTEHKLDYTEYLGDDVGIVDQKNGQLMGSVISFPILCLVNACVNRTVMERVYGRSFTLVETGMLINGDDCLLHLPSNQECYQLWQDMTASVGLKMSLGKNYFSEEFCVINSRMFVPNPPSWVQSYGWCRKVPFVNPGHLQGVGRVQGTAEASEFGFIQRQHALIEECRPEHVDFLTGCWTDLNRSKLISLSTPGQSWYVPQLYGGLGVLPDSRFRFDRDVSVAHRKVMRWICNQDSADVYELSSALENPERPNYVAMGTSYIAGLMRKLNMRPKLVREEFYLYDAQKREAESTEFTQFALTSGKREQKRTETFKRMIVCAKDTAPANGMPLLMRGVIRPSISVPAPCFDWRWIESLLDLDLHARFCRDEFVVAL